MAAGKKKGGGRKKPAAKKTAKKSGKKSQPKKPKKPARPGGSAARKHRNARKSKPKSRGTGKQKRLNAAQQSIRDTMLMVRVDGQGWSLADAAQEAGIGVETARKALYKKREAQPPLLDEDPVKIVESLVRQWQAAIADYEHLAAAAVEKGEISSAVGAKKGAGEARQRLTELLQSFGTLPNDLGTLTYTIEIRAIALRINDALTDFFASIDNLKLPAKEKKKIGRLLESTVKEIDSIATKPETVTAPEEEDQDG